jgi:hypothetical protein
MPGPTRIVLFKGIPINSWMERPACRQDIKIGSEPERKELAFSSG